MFSKTSLRGSLIIQLRVIGALLMREIVTRFGRQNLGFLWLFLEPMAFTLGVTALWTITGAHHDSHLSITAFAVTGYSSVMLWRNTVLRCIGAIEPNLSLMFHRNVRLLDIFASRIILEVAGATISFIILTSVFIFVGWMEPPADVLKILFAWILLAWLGTSLALVIGSLATQFEVIERIWHPISYLLFPLSGALFMVNWLPSAVREAVLWIPMVHATEMIREGYFGAAVRAHYDLVYLSSVCLSLTLIGLALVRETERLVEPE